MKASVLLSGILFHESCPLFASHCDDRNGRGAGCQYLLPGCKGQCEILPKLGGCVRCDESQISTLHRDKREIEGLRSLFSPLWSNWMMTGACSVELSRATRRHYTKNMLRWGSVIQHDKHKHFQMGVGSFSVWQPLMLRPRILQIRPFLLLEHALLYNTRQPERNRDLAILPKTHLCKEGVARVLASKRQRSPKRL